MKSSKLSIASTGAGIIERISGKKLSAEVILVARDEIKTVLKKYGWVFNWKKEYANDQRQLYKLNISDNSSIQGLLSLEPIKGQQYLEMHLIELAPQNKGENRKYLGVARHLVAFACKMAFDMGFEGFVAFTAKTKLIEHYEKAFGADRMFGQRMCIATEAARNLVNLHYQTP
ncbi:MAG: hypothetical protein JNK79_01525 [Chitinophagaceae bacterium]|nr:hypothetical protein [Chitinophagaceae bacterium]